MSTPFLRQLSRLTKDRAGNFATLTALIAVPLAAAAGLAVDYASAVHQRTNLQEIADGAALAGGKIFDGTNLAAAQAEATRFITAYADTTPANLSYTITANGRILSVNLTGAVPTNLMRIVNINSVNIGVNSQATAPAKPDIVTITPTQAQGWYYKVITIRVVRPNATAETVVGTVTYQPTTHNNDGQGTMTAVPSGPITLGQYTKLVLQMDVKDDGCPLGKTASISNNSAVSCNSKNSAGTKYDLTLRTDDPNTSNYLFVDGSQLPKGVTLPIENYFGCQATQKHAWEDGGGWDRQDFFYTISSQCSSADGDAVRLTN
ncbi:pilus assembly protein [Agrobacterium rhizogenes]|uniref:TadE/TadG family type IV pilus assembly protein n=2 Tax=unclassified Rhizobium TaxID=2613769 RepID=A0AAU7SL48_9HYPH|nr:pilus assembly protein [Rhizobium rhizogenes]NTJ80355.1 pilus assembly protein [Rhizobium rhizogenes]